MAQFLPAPHNMVFLLLTTLSLHGHRGMMRKLLCDIHEVPVDGELCLPSRLGRDQPSAPSVQEINTVIGTVRSS